MYALVHGDISIDGEFSTFPYYLPLVRTMSSAFAQAKMDGNRGKGINPGKCFMRTAPSATTGPASSGGEELTTTSLKTLHKKCPLILRTGILKNKNR
jgi:hypothetical protein